MGPADPVRHIPPGERVPGHPDPGMAREQAIDTDGMWAGFVRTMAGMTSAWHHHGDYESTIYVVSGTIRMEFGHGGAEGIDGGPGDFFYVPPWAIHREINPSDEEGQIIVVRAGSGPAVVNVDGPAD
ncbi:MAG TPA: cupin domain-containing protein [Acidimicrobiia bacterium]